MRQIEDFSISIELLMDCLTSRKHITNIPEDGKILHVFYDEQPMSIRVRVESEMLMRKPEGAHVPWRTLEISEE